MPRTARIIVPGVPHHVTQRGNRREDVFLAPEDYQSYFDLLRDYSQRHQIEVLGWCLMTNHVHLVVVPPNATALALALRTVHMRYAQWLTRRQGWQGRVWQGRFYSCPLDDAHCWAAMRYVEQNPVRAGLVTAAEEYPWSSAAAHCGLAPQEPLGARWLDQVPAEVWRAELQSPLADEQSALVRSRTYRGLPCGEAPFVARVSALVGRELVFRGRGRPRTS